MLYQNAYSFVYELYSLHKCGSWHHPFSLHQVCPLVAVGDNSAYRSQAARVIPLKDASHDEWWGNTTLISYK